MGELFHGGTISGGNYCRGELLQGEKKYKRDCLIACGHSMRKKRLPTVAMYMLNDEILIIVVQWAPLK